MTEIKNREKAAVLGGDLGMKKAARKHALLAFAVLCMEYALQAAVERMDTRKERELALECKKVMNRMSLISFCAENVDALSEEQRQELEEAYAETLE